MVSRRAPLTIDLRETPATARLPRRDGRWVRLGRWWFQPRTGEWVPVVAGGLSVFAPQQVSIRWRNDDGSEAAATWLTTEIAGSAGDDVGAGSLSSHTPVTPNARFDTNIRIRCRIAEVGTLGGTISPQLRYSKNGGAYVVVDGASSNVRSAASANFIDDDVTTEQLVTEPGTFAAGRMDDSTGATSSITLVTGGATEVEFSVQFRSIDLAVGDTIDLRVYNGLATLNGYSVSPRFVVGIGPRMIAVGGTDPTTSTTIAIPASVQTDDDLYVVFTSRDHTSGDADPTVTDNDTGGNTWTKVGQATNKKLNIFWKKATSGTSGKTITVSGAIGSLSAGLVVVVGATSGDPTANMTLESNASGDETAAGFTPTIANSHVVLAISNTSNDIVDVAAQACTDPGTLTERFEHASTGGLDCATNVSSRIQVGGPTATGNFTWTQTNGTTETAAWAVKPPTTATPRPSQLTTLGVG